MRYGHSPSLGPAKKKNKTLRYSKKKTGIKKKRPTRYKMGY